VVDGCCGRTRACPKSPYCKADDRADDVDGELQKTDMDEHLPRGDRRCGWLPGGGQSRRLPARDCGGIVGGLLRQPWLWRNRRWPCSVGVVIAGLHPFEELAANPGEDSNDG